MSPRIRVARSGFTLMELIIVVAIMAALIAFLLPSLQEARRKAIRTLCVANQFQLGVGVANYASSNEDIIVPAEYPEENWLRRINGEPLVISGASSVGDAEMNAGEADKNGKRGEWGVLVGNMQGVIPFNPNNSTKGDDIKNWEFYIEYYDDNGNYQTLSIGRDTLIDTSVSNIISGTAISITVRPMRKDPDYDMQVNGTAIAGDIQGYTIEGVLDFHLEVIDGNKWQDFILNLNGGAGRLTYGDGAPAWASPFPWWGLATYYGGHTPIYDLMYHSNYERQFYHCPAGYDLNRGGYMINGYASNFNREAWTRRYGVAYSQISSIKDPGDAVMILDDSYSIDGINPPFGDVLSDFITYRWAGNQAWRSTIHGQGVFVNGVITYADGHNEIRTRPYYAETEKQWSVIYSANRDETGKLSIMPF